MRKAFPILCTYRSYYTHPESGVTAVIVQDCPMGLIPTEDEMAKLLVKDEVADLTGFRLSTWKEACHARICEEMGGVCDPASVPAIPLPKDHEWHDKPKHEPEVAKRKQEPILNVDRDDIVTFTYTNHKGITAKRTVRVRSFDYGCDGEYYTSPRILLTGHDFDKGAMRSFDAGKIINLKFFSGLHSDLPKSKG